MSLIYWIATVGKLFTHIAFTVISAPIKWGTKGGRSDWTDLTA